MAHERKQTPSSQKQFERANAASFVKLLEEAKRINPSVRDIVWSETAGTWYLFYSNGQADEFLDFGDIILHLNWVRI